MPSALTEAHRLAQLQLGVETVARLRAVFRLLDPDDLDASFADWLAVVVPLVQSGRETSSSIAAAYLAALRTAELADPDEFSPVRAGPVDADLLATSMLVTGVISLRSNLARAMPLAAALDIAEARSAAAGMRHVLNGGRETITGSVRADPRARGWQRVTSANACTFCATLAGRGAVFSEDSVDFAAHDGCGCGAEPIYR